MPNDIFVSASPEWIMSLGTVSVEKVSTVPFSCIVALSLLFPNAIVSADPTDKLLPIAIASDAEAVFPRPIVTE